MMKRMLAFFLVSIMVLSSLPLSGIAEMQKEFLSEVYVQPSSCEVVFTSGEKVVSVLYVEEGCTISALPVAPERPKPSWDGSMGRRSLLERL